MVNKFISAVNCKVEILPTIKEHMSGHEKVLKASCIRKELRTHFISVNVYYFQLRF